MRAASPHTPVIPPDRMKSTSRMKWSGVKCAATRGGPATYCFLYPGGRSDRGGRGDSERRVGGGRDGLQGVLFW